MVKIIKDGKVIHKSKNLRGILDHARREPVCIVTVRPQCPVRFGVIVDFVFFDNSTCATVFNDRSVAEHWIQARRSWGTPEIFRAPHWTSYVYG